MEKFSLYFILFLIYSFMGWSIEVVNSLISEKKFVNRGFMLGPYCPIYGYSAIIMVLYLDQYRDNVLTVFLLAVVVCSIVEYLVSYAMEKLFNARWWDYSNKKFNINGRVCLTNAFLFGILGVILVYFINPFLYGLLSEVNTKVLMIISIILLVLFVIDGMTWMGVTCRLKNSMKRIKKDSTEEMNKKVKEVIESKILNRRIFKAFPSFKINIIGIKDIKEKIEEKIDKYENKIDKK